MHNSTHCISLLRTHVRVHVYIYIYMYYVYELLVIILCYVSSCTCKAAHDFQFHVNSDFPADNCCITHTKENFRLT